MHLTQGLHRAVQSHPDRVGRLALNSDRYLEWLLAVWWAGGVVNT